MNNCKCELVEKEKNWECRLCGENLSYEILAETESICKNCVLLENKPGFWSCLCGKKLISRRAILETVWSENIEPENFYIVEKDFLGKWNNITLSFGASRGDQIIEIQNIIDNFKKTKDFRGCFCLKKTPGSGCGGYWDEDIYLYIRSRDKIYRYNTNDCSCFGIDEEQFKNSEFILNEELYFKEEGFNILLPYPFED